MNHPYRPASSIEFPKTGDEKNLDLLGLFHYVAGGLIALFSCLFIVHIALGFAMTAGQTGMFPGFGVPGVASPPFMGPMFIALGAGALMLGWVTAALLLFAGRCIRLRKGHTFCLVVAGLACLSVPLGTILGVFTLVLLTKPHIRMLFEHRADAARDTAPPMVRPWLLVVAGIVAVSAVSVFAVSRCVDRMKLKSAGTSSGRSSGAPADTPESRSRAAFRVAPGPVPTGLPLLGPEGVDGDGYPTRYVDRAALRSLLRAHKFKELDQYIGELQTAFEADPSKEYWPLDAGAAFGSAEPELTTDLDIWVAASMNSFASRFARGNHWEAVMWARRGYKYRSETPEADYRAMREAGQRAVADLDEALKLRPGLVAAMHGEIGVAMATSDNVRRDAMRDRALRACQGCVQPRAMYLRTLTPRWGGSYEAMRAFVATSPLSANRRLRALSGYEQFDRADLLEVDGKNAEALTAIEQALRAG